VSKREREREREKKPERKIGDRNSVSVFIYQGITFVNKLSIAELEHNPLRFFQLFRFILTNKKFVIYHDLFKLNRKQVHSLKLLKHQNRV
jgi:hypothetical protein